ncbi:hypothetical protein GCM10009838_54140 [Catenulispora subtropica]|uniref:Uncharacterized protein n=2 Tax=Catenulispora subtropica TaxID=450798 RepID=A0ABN2SE72_9ACTN
MRLASGPEYSEVDLTASTEELNALADAVEMGVGLLSSTPSPDSHDLAGVEVRASSGPGVLLRLDSERQILMISGDVASRTVFAENLRDMASTEDGGHLHIDYFPRHFYLAEGSLPLVVNSPHGGMPTC